MSGGEYVPRQSLRSTALVLIYVTSAVVLFGESEYMNRIYLLTEGDLYTYGLGYSTTRRARTLRKQICVSLLREMLLV